MSEDIYLFSYPRSGNSLVTDYVQEVFGDHWCCSTIYRLETGYGHREHGKRRLVKTHDLAHALLPNTIHLVRDGRDCIISLAHYIQAMERNEEPWEDIFDYLLAGKRKPDWGEYVELHLDASHNALPVMRYEDLLENPFRILQSILGKYGPVPTSNEAETKLQARTDKYRDGWDNFYRRQSAGAFREEIPAYKVAEFNQRYKRQLEAMHYPMV